MAQGSRICHRYDALEDEFALAEVIMGARAHANLTQAGLAKRMRTSRSAIVRLKSGHVRL